MYLFVVYLFIIMIVIIKSMVNNDVWLCLVIVATPHFESKNTEKSQFKLESLWFSTRSPV